MFWKTLAYILPHSFSAHVHFCVLTRAPFNFTIVVFYVSQLVYAHARVGVSWKHESKKDLLLTVKPIK